MADASIQQDAFSFFDRAIGNRCQAHADRRPKKLCDDAAAHITRADNTDSNRLTTLFSLLEFSVDNYHNCALATQTISVAKCAAHFLKQPKPTTLKWKVDFHTKAFRYSREPELATTRRSIRRKTTNSSGDFADNCRNRALAVSMSFTSSTHSNVPLRSFFKISKMVRMFTNPAGGASHDAKNRPWKRPQVSQDA